MKKIFLLLILPILSEGLHANPSTIRTIPQGRLEGLTMISRTGRPFLAFLKVPYAKPPLDHLRWALPEPHNGWSGVYNATSDGVICTQRNIFVKNQFYLSGQEDCLYLNVYTPQIMENSTEKLPVMVWFHGGGWVTGSGNSYYYPPNYLLDRDIVLVAPNYRLGPMGFLAMEDDEMSGNWGLKDQNLALKWIQQNIGYFGGDPDLVTLFGESAGGSSVHFHMMSPMSRGLFHRGISQSGTAFTAWSLAEPQATRNNTIKMAELLDCPSSPTKALLKCLRTKPVEEIITKDIHFMEWFRDPMIPFKPVVEKIAPKGTAFLPKHPEEVVKNGEVAPVPWITGLNSGDGALRVAGIYDNEQLIKELNENFERIIPMSLFLKSTKNQNVTNTLRRFYFGNEAVSHQTHMNVVDLWTDGWFLAGAEQAVRMHTKYAKNAVFYYFFSYRGTLSFSSVFGDETRDFGVCHADELIYLFPMDKLFPGHNYSHQDLKHMNLFIQMWTDFAKYGDPTPGNYTWKPVTTADLEFLHIGQNHLQMEENLLPERSALWNQIHRQLTNRIRDEL